MISLNKALWFTLRTDKIKKDGKAPINMFYTLNNIRLRFNTDQSIYPAYWDKSAHKAIYIRQADAKKLLPGLTINELLTENEIGEVNDRLAAIRTRVAAIENKFIHLEKSFSATMVLDELKRQLSAKTDQLAKVEEVTGFLFDFMDAYISDHKSTRVQGSLTVYKSVKNHLKAYQDATGNKVTFESIDLNFFNKLQSFLINKVKVDKEGKESPALNNTTIAKALSTLKTFLGYARKQGIMVNDNYKNFSIKKEKLEVIALDQQELDAIIGLDLTDNSRLNKARDLFLLSCSTGLRYSDVQQLRREHIKNDVINLIVKKTKTELTVPLNTISAGILYKHRDSVMPIPMVSNQNLNYSIKDLCKLAGIIQPVEIVRFHGVKRKVIVYPKYELIHFHTGRKTFCTLSLEKGMSAEQVMSISGHTDYKSFKRYVDVTEKLKKVVMLKAWGPVNNLKIVS